jgi:hypothetical protein
MPDPRRPSDRAYRKIATPTGYGPNPRAGGGVMAAPASRFLGGAVVTSESSSEQNVEESAALLREHFSHERIDAPGNYSASWPTPITADTALRLAKFFGTSERFWLNLQVRYDIEVEKGRLSGVVERDVSVYRAAVQG